MTFLKTLKAQINVWMTLVVACVMLYDRVSLDERDCVRSFEAGDGLF